LLVNAGLNAALIRPLLDALGAGGAGVGGALATIGTELFTCGMFVWLIGRDVIDRRLLSTASRLVLSCAAAIAVDRACASLGPSRLVFDAAAYCVVAVGTGAVRVGELLDFVSAARRSRG